jgi:ectoine hydroxylase-related dioxygenase (phytanoyl-CoA dioxygenase family)
MTNISEQEIHSYQVDGAVCLRNIFETRWIELVRKGIAAAIKTPGPSGENYNPKGPGFFGDLDMWQRHDEFRRFILDSPAAGVVARLMSSERVNFFYDQMLVKEAGSESATPWHQDQPYWAISGKQVSSIWMPVDSVGKDICLEFVAGSHLWGKEFNPKHFSDQSPYEGTGLPAMPNIESNRENFTILSWELEPGDCIVFQAMMVHGAAANTSSASRRRVLSTRWAGDDARYCVRPGETAIPTFETDLKHGEKFTGPLFPEVWPGSNRAPSQN